MCRLLGVTRQAYYQHFWHIESDQVGHELILQQVRSIRKDHRSMGGRKLYELLYPFMLEHGIKMGRDALFDLLAANMLLVRKKRRVVYTTQSFHWLRKHPNLIIDYIPTSPNKLWVSDITYLKIVSDFVYISFITDAYSHKIVGYHIAPTLATVETLQALKMALAGLNGPLDELIHHSDRGIQYCSAEYVNLLQDNHIRISMTENGDPRENAVAERLNGIIKHEYLHHQQFNTIEHARAYLKTAVDLYNTQRPHLSLDLLVPERVHSSTLSPKKRWKNKPRRQVVNSFQD
jgi:putative transposase